MRELIAHAVAMLRNPRLVLLHLVGNAVLVIAASFWLLIPEAHVWQLVVAAISLLLIVVLFLWLHSATFTYAMDPTAQKFRDAFVPKIWRFVWLAIGFFVLYWFMQTVNGWTDSIWQTSGYVYSRVPSFLRPSGSTSYATLDFLLSVLCWYVLPCIFLPLIAARVAGVSSWHGVRALGRRQYWLAMAITCFFGVWVTGWIVGWTPGRTLTVQTVSLVLRLGFAYLLATAAWLITAGVLGYFINHASTEKSTLFSALWNRIFPAGSENRSILQRTLDVITDRRLIVLQIIGTVIMAIATRAPAPWADFEGVAKIVAGIVVGLLLLTGFLWAYSSTLVYAADPAPSKFRQAFRFRFSRIGWLLLGLVIAIALGAVAESGLWMLNRHDNYVWLITRAISAMSNYLLPCLVLPLVAAKVLGSRLREGIEPLRRWRYWLGMAVVVILMEWLSALLSAGTSSQASIWTQIVGTIRSALANVPQVVEIVAEAALVSYFVTRQRETSNLNRQAVS